MATSREVENLAVLQNIGDCAKGLIPSIRIKNRKQKKLTKWRELQITSFLRILSDTTIDLIVAYRKKRLATVAWLTRNLLELSIWIEYCTSSECNGLAFRNDTFKDLVGMADSMGELDLLKYRSTKDFLVRAVPRVFDPIEAQDELESLKKQYKKSLPKLIRNSPFLSPSRVSQLAMAIGQPAIKDNHMSVSEVAISLGRGDLFRRQNKFLSKFAHPTALLAHFPSHRTNHPADFFLEDATLLASQCLYFLAEFSGDTFPKGKK
jgi:hypothetical protein